jgi:hypothetical protein
MALLTGQVMSLRKAHNFTTLTEDLSHMTLVQGPTCLEVFIEDTFVGLACPTEEGYDFIAAK